MVYFTKFKNKFLSNSKIRKAILLAVDRDELVKSVLNGTGESARTFVPSGIGIKGISKDFPEEVPTSLKNTIHKKLNNYR